MKRKRVVSSAIISIGYDADKEILEVEFVETHHVYQYFDVPEQIYVSLINASSIGAFFNHHIRNLYEEDRIE